MWQLSSKEIDSQTVVSTVAFEGRAMSFGDVIDAWEDSQEFRAWFVAGIVDSPFEAFFWETPPVTLETLERPFEYVLVEGTSLVQLRPDPSPFMSHFSDSAVVSFPNLGGDAILVVPAPVWDPDDYTHLANFLRRAPADQIDAFWSCVGTAMKSRMSLQPIWLSTAGLGVSWLHLRLDSRPKYYRYAPYKSPEVG